MSSLEFSSCLSEFAFRVNGEDALGGFMCTESPLLWAAQPENAAAPPALSSFSLSRFNCRKYRGIPAQLLPLFHLSLLCLQGDQENSTWRRQ